MTLDAHLKGGATTVCRAWEVVRRDGAVFGFTDHDQDLSFGGVRFRAGTGLTARALAQTTGLSVDNAEGMGALSDAAVTEADLDAGRFDGARVRVWAVNWADVAQRAVEFAGTIGEVARAGGAFRAELRGLAEALNLPGGRVFQRSCAAVLGDAACGVDLTAPVHRAEVAIEAVEGARVFRWAGLDGFADRWFERGRLAVLGGAGAGLVGVIKGDRLEANGRVIELWEALRAALAPGDLVRLEAGCDRRAATCRLKFVNFARFRGFPHVPGEDWLTAYPVAAGRNDGGSLTG